MDTDSLNENGTETHLKNASDGNEMFIYYYELLFTIIHFFPDTTQFDPVL